MPQPPTANPRALLIELNAAARKSLSQNFLTSPHWADQLTRVITEANAEEYWEIGPGLGALTAKLVEKTDRPIRVFEYDRKLAAYLRETFPTITVIEGDVLDADLKGIAPEATKIALLSNLPYHLSSPIFFRLAEIKERFVRLVLTFQKEFADRLIAEPRTSDYGGLSVIAQLHFRMQSLGVLPKGAFYPPPAIASEALMLEPKGPIVGGAAHLSVLVKAAFAHRRKKVSSNLKEAFPETPPEMILATLEKLGIGPMARPEELSKEDYLALARSLRPQICGNVCEK
jgi:16S rRNA (adenine1518-N6/adenine1519-N6)-dimethyltransferase